MVSVDGPSNQTRRSFPSLTSRRIPKSHNQTPKKIKPKKQLRHTAAALPQIFPPPPSSTPAPTNAGKMEAAQYSRRAGELGARAVAVADEIDAAIRREALIPAAAAAGVAGESREGDGMDVWRLWWWWAIIFPPLYLTEWLAG